MACITHRLRISALASSSRLCPYRGSWLVGGLPPPSKLLVPVSLNTQTSEQGGRVKHHQTGSETYVNITLLESATVTVTLCNSTLSELVETFFRFLAVFNISTISIIKLVTLLLNSTSHWVKTACHHNVEDMTGKQENQPGGTSQADTFCSV